MEKYIHKAGKYALGLAGIIFIGIVIFIMTEFIRHPNEYN